MTNKKNTYWAIQLSNGSLLLDTDMLIPVLYGTKKSAISSCCAEEKPVKVQLSIKIDDRIDDQKFANHCKDLAVKNVQDSIKSMEETLTNLKNTLKLYSIEVEPKRKPGYYVVKFTETSPPTIAYRGQTRWLILGSNIYYYDNNFYSIGREIRVDRDLV